MTLLAVASVASAGAVSAMSNVPPSALRTRGSRQAPVVSDVAVTAIPSLAPGALSHATAVSGIRALMRGSPVAADDDGVMAQCLPPNTLADGEGAEQDGRMAYRADLQRVVVAMMRDAVAASDDATREAFARAEVLQPRHMMLRVRRADPDSPPSLYFAPYGIALHLRDEFGRWRAFALTLSAEAPSIITPITPCGARGQAAMWCLAKTLGPTFWGDCWAAIESGIGEHDDARFSSTRAGATVSPGWPTPDTSVLDSPDMEEVAEVLLERAIARPVCANGRIRSRPRRQVANPASADTGGVRALASRMTLSGLECLAAVVRTENLPTDAITLLQHFWPSALAPTSVEMATLPPPTLATFAHEPFGGPLGRGVQWSLPPGVRIEYLPDLTQNGVHVFDIDGALYGTTVARTRKHASDLRPLADIRRALGPLTLCRISRGVGIDVDGMCLECHTEREGEVSVTEQGATITQHQAQEASPLVRLRVAVYSRPFPGEDGNQAFYAFGRLGGFDEHGVPVVTADSPVVDASVYTPELDGELTYYEQATTAGPVGGRRVRLSLGGMEVAAPFGTYRDRHGTLRGVVQVANDMFYRFSLPAGDIAATSPQVRLHRRRADDHDIREYRIAQRHRATAENAIVLPTISFGEVRTLLQLYLGAWQRAPSPADVWRGLEEIPLSVGEARTAIHALTRAIEQRVTASRAGPDASAPPAIDPALVPAFNRLWRHWQRFPVDADGFVNAIARDFVARPSPISVWSQLPFVGDVQTTRDVLSIFETVFPGMSGLQALVTGQASDARDVQNRMQRVSRRANVAVAEVTLVDGTRTIYYCMSGLQRGRLQTNRPAVRIVDAGRAYAQRAGNVIAQQRVLGDAQMPSLPTESPALRLVMADANLPTYNTASGQAKSRTLDTERMILAQIYADFPSGENVVRSIVMCSRMPFCDSCAVNLAMAPYHYPDAELRFYYVAPSPRYLDETVTTPLTDEAQGAVGGVPEERHPYPRSSL
ncbi:hypothetical protein [Pandoraea pnomenusa]|uniref:hypothetical protein n=1 Tax=Pandoraea pnomenusa TaxID=93220 RepID=UPI0033418208